MLDCDRTISLMVIISYHYLHLPAKNDSLVVNQPLVGALAAARPKLLLPSARRLAAPTLSECAAEFQLRVRPVSGPKVIRKLQDFSISVPDTAFCSGLSTSHISRD